jgi:hypothetical protein
MIKGPELRLKAIAMAQKTLRELSNELLSCMVLLPIVYW